MESLGHDDLSLGGIESVFKDIEILLWVLSNLHIIGQSSLPLWYSNPSFQNQLLSVRIH